jgi:hypothetical protein
MSDFTQILQSWQMFYGSTATAAATLAGLLFVSLSISRTDLDHHARLYARSTFGNLTNVLALSLIFLIPHQQPDALAIALLTFGAANFLAAIGSAISAAKTPGFRAASIVRVVGLPLILSLAILTEAILIYKRFPSAMYWPIAIIVLLLSSASRNAWDILFPGEKQQIGVTQKLVPTPASVTPTADAPVAPDAGAAHL